MNIEKLFNKNDEIFIDDYEDAETLSSDDECLTINEWNENECREIQAFNSNQEIGKIIAGLTHDLSEKEKISIYKYYSELNFKKSSINYSIRVIIMFMSKNNIELSNFNLKNFFETLNIKRNNVEKKDKTTLTKSLLNLQNNFTGFINGWILYIRSFIINDYKRNKINYLFYNDLSENIIIELKNDLWLEKMKDIRNVFKKLFFPIFLFSIKISDFNKDKNKYIIKSNVSVEKSVDYVMCLILLVLYFYNLIIFPPKNNEKRFCNKEFLKLINLNKFKIIKFISYHLDKLDIIYLHSHQFYFNIFNIIILNIEKKYLKLEILKELINHF